jgi:hypothetical protein
MTDRARGEPAAGDGKEREPVPSYPLLVRVGGRWLCRHELAALVSSEHVQLRP